ncbi:hypothetical protein A5844_001384 [Enterococcus sp. 10A9_DIV0425]|uniref:Uncharacterized protein n=1 Tax=Candidatus Enterococcus wittei TaxID=1987383 RepID=A0A242K0S2_9ENTE|nr:ETX/MTX2 family pore-forming toxin [Enterococcus sp. 10A9_DIV0425]OTP11248.1 hypothetical protein A5844_001382 [Enterococcus sp. 10A9_DIV0425]OTP11250.1 hypothetical protein A5844_001384 [Enterococcus sp. 10A9_DIV0425]THE15798.1 hypothetical protein E1H99_02215 [Enterococcus hirae]
MKKGLNKMGVYLCSALGMFSCFTVLTNVEAAEQKPMDVTTSASSSKAISQTIIDRISIMSYALSYQMYHWGDIEDSESLSGNDCLPRNLVSENYAVGLNNDMDSAHTSTTVNSSIFHNNTDQDQTFSTPSYTETYTDSITTSTTNSAGVSTTTSVEVGLPLLAGADMSVELRYDFSSTTSTTKETQRSWSVPGQSINVKPGHTVEVKWVFYTGQASGSVDLQEVISADVPYKKDAQGKIYTHGLGDVVGNKELFYDNFWNRYISESRTNWKRIDYNSAGHKIGAGVYNADYGSGFVLEANDRTAGTKEIIAVGKYLGQ